MATETATVQTPESNGIQTTAAIVFGGVLALVGVLGPALGGANGELVVFGRNYLHDVVHLGSGLAGLAAGYAAGGKYAGTYSKVLGVTYLLVTVIGFVATGFAASLLNINFADNLLHLVLALAFLVIGFGLSQD
ncbi:DUF4383 domain-containing protein [Natronomonas sp. EA1]|uniref:DUF4383 domain-containing protein n=1 Tax=Natronomonas sp. EA1 TaxID=3421655 RepID=UPI003EBABA52